MNHELLHELGHLALATADPVRYTQVVRLAQRGAPAGEAERYIFGTDHSEWSVTLAQAWGFPDEIVAAIADHHAGSQGAISWVVTRAREKAAQLGIGDGVVAPMPPDPDSEAEMLTAVENLGGDQAILQRVSWYQGALSAAA